MAGAGFFDSIKDSWQHYKEEEKKRDEAWQRKCIETQEKDRAARQKAAEEAAKKAKDEENCKLMRQQIMQLKVRRAERAESCEIGSNGYLRARYGDYAYSSMLKVAAKELGCSEKEAAEFLTENYSEALWKPWEDEDVELFLGNR